jgi:hypothetical protein
LDAVRCAAAEGAKWLATFESDGGVSAHVRDKVAGWQYLRGASAPLPGPRQL